MIKSKKLSRFNEIEHAFFNRLGGKSNGIYKSLNCGPGSFDSKKNILKNLTFVEKKIKSGLSKMVLLNQIHSNKFYYIDKTSRLNHKKFTGDALITNKSNTPIAVLTADCAPILLFDKKNKTILFKPDLIFFWTRIIFFDIFFLSSDEPGAQLKPL